MSMIVSRAPDFSHELQPAPAPLAAAPSAMAVERTRKARREMAPSALDEAFLCRDMGRTVPRPAHRGRVSSPSPKIKPKKACLKQRFWRKHPVPGAMVVFSAGFPIPTSLATLGPALD